MDYSELFKGQMITLTCPNDECNHQFEVDGGKLFKKNASVVCPKCTGNIVLENQDSIKALDKQMKEFMKMFK